jgi:hypothetical protein
MKDPLDYDVAYLPGRMHGMRPNGSNKAPKYHYVPKGTQEGEMVTPALCGAKPKYRSYGWCPVEQCVPICERCRAVMDEPTKDY